MEYITYKAGTENFYVCNSEGKRQVQKKSESN